jgi:hypothetical protein
MKDRKEARNFEDYRVSNPHLRYGQAFCTYHGLEDKALYYEEDDNKAIERCALHITTWLLAA